MSNAQPKAHAAGVPVYCAHDQIVDVAKLVPSPKNPNQHPDSQIQLLGRIILQAGWRQPITVSTRSGFIVKGHGRLQAALLEGLTEVPVDFQDYATEEDEIADMVADNRLAELADMDQRMLADIFAEIDVSGLSVEMTGFGEAEASRIRDAFAAAASAEFDDDGEDQDKPDKPRGKMCTCPYCGEEFEA